MQCYSITLFSTGSQDLIWQGLGGRVSWVQDIFHETAIPSLSPTHQSSTSFSLLLSFLLLLLFLSSLLPSFLSSPLALSPPSLSQQCIGCEALMAALHLESFINRGESTGECPSWKRLLRADQGRTRAPAISRRASQSPKNTSVMDFLPPPPTTPTTLPPHSTPNR